MAKKIIKLQKNVDRTPNLDVLLKGEKKSGKAEIAKIFADDDEDGDGWDIYSGKSDLERAEGYIDAALNTKGKIERLRLLNKAIAISPDCAEAYCALAIDEKSALAAAKLFQKAMLIEERMLGKDFFKKHTGYFFNIPETQAYMICRRNFMAKLWQAGEHAEAMMHLMALLELDKDDHQGMRYVLVSSLAFLNRYEELDELLNHSEFKDDSAIYWVYPRALLTFIQTGNSATSKEHLTIALKSNKFAHLYLTGKRLIPKNLPQNMIEKSEEEGYTFAAEYIDIWAKVPGAIEWLIEQSKSIKS